MEMEMGCGIDGGRFLTGLGRELEPELEIEER